MKKSKNTSLTTIEIALQAQFKPDRNAVIKAFEEVEHNRRAFTLNAIRFGLCALAAKAIIGHGGFYAWLSDVLKTQEGFSNPIAERTAKDYIGLANILVEKLKNPNSLKDELGERVRDFCEITLITLDEFDIVSILSDREATESLLQTIIKDMSLTKLRQLLREGAEKAYSDTVDDKNMQKIPTLKPNTIPIQTNFFDDLFDEVRATVEVKREDPKFLEMSKDELAELGNYLLKQGREILEIAKNK